MLALGVIVARRDIWSYDAHIMAQVAHGMVTEQSVRVHDDPLGLSTPYAAYGIGMSALMVISEYVAMVLHTPVGGLHSLINAVVLAATAVTLWFLARALGAGPRLASATALVTAAATPLLAYAATSFSEPATALGAGLGLLGIVRANHGGTRRDALVGGALVGAGVGLATMMRFDSLALVAPVLCIGLLVVTRDRLRALAACAAAATPGLAVVVAYNVLRYGSPLQTRYQGVPSEQAWSHPLLSGVYGLVASPGRGLLVYAPIALVMVFFWRPVWRRSPVLALVCAALLVDRILLYATWHAWHGGVAWGPRFLVPALPALAPFILAALQWTLGTLRGAAPDRRWRTAAARALLILVGLSTGIQFLGAFTDPAKDRLMAALHDAEATLPADAAGAASPARQHVWDEAMFQWRLAPVLDHVPRLLTGQNIGGRFTGGGLRLPGLLLATTALAGALRATLRRPQDALGAPAPPRHRALPIPVQRTESEPRAGHVVRDIP